jgi:hypothetical protein
MGTILHIADDRNRLFDCAMHVALSLRRQAYLCCMISKNNQ